MVRLRGTNHDSRCWTYGVLRTNYMMPFNSNSTDFKKLLAANFMRRIPSTSQTHSRRFKAIFGVSAERCNHSWNLLSMQGTVLADKTSGWRPWPLPDTKPPTADSSAGHFVTMLPSQSWRTRAGFHGYCQHNTASDVVWCKLFRMLQVVTCPPMLCDMRQL
jgi:hypothetical protein